MSKKSKAKQRKRTGPSLSAPETEFNMDKRPRPPEPKRRK